MNHKLHIGVTQNTTPYETDAYGKIRRAPEIKNVYLNSSMACRHGFVCGATGTGKTVTLKVLAEAFANIGSQVIITDIKGDVSGLAVPATMTDSLRNSVEECHLDNYKPEAAPNVVFYNPFLKNDIGMTKAAPLPLYRLSTNTLARLLGLTQAQSGILDIIDCICKDNHVRVTNVADLQWMLNYIQKNRSQVSAKYGYAANSSIGVVQRSLLRLASDGIASIFGEERDDEWQLIPKTYDKITDKQEIKILDCTRLAYESTLYSAYLLWMIEQINGAYPEIGNTDVPRLVLIFDEAHLIFEGAEPVLIERVERAVKLVRSKGIGIYFCSQSPSDIPEKILAQCANRIEHALRAYTPNEQKKVKAAAASFRPNPEFNTEDIIGQLATGEALISFLDEQGIPEPVQKCRIIPPRCSMGAMR